MIIDNSNFVVEDITNEFSSLCKKIYLILLLFDTAGRQVVDEKMMNELKLIHKKFKPTRNYY